MKRALSIGLFTLLGATLLSPAPAIAGKGHGKGGGKGHHGAKFKLEGAGQRSHFSFGGKVTRMGGKTWGSFMVIVHPLGPPGDTMAVSCRYTKFHQVEVNGNELKFRAHGHCLSMMKNGKNQPLKVTGDFTIIDNEDGTDAIDLDNVSGGISIPGGELDFGDLTLRHL